MRRNIGSELVFSGLAGGRIYPAALRSDLAVLASHSASPLLALARALGLAVLVAVSHGATAQSNADFVAAGVAVRMEADALTSLDAAQGDILGYAVALSGDRALVGAAAASDASGAAYVFGLAGGRWTQEAKLIPDDADAGDSFGVAVALDGDRALVGGYRGGQVVAYVFHRTAGGWVQEATLPTAAAAASVVSVAVALQGGRAVVGANQHHGRQGAAFVFGQTAAGWAMEAELTAPDGAAGDAFGSSVALSDTRVVAGAYGRDGGRGAAYVFEREATAWSHRTTLSAPNDDAPGGLGVSVAIDGDRVLAGAPFYDDGRGAAYAFDLAAGPSPSTLRSPFPVAGDSFGWSVALRDERALVGARLDDGRVSNGGAAFLFRVSGAGWAPEAKLLGETTPRACAGVSVALSDDHALVGAPYHDASRGTALAYSVTPASVATDADAALDLSLSVAPNPVAHRARVTVGLAQAGPVRASVFDLLGREVAVLADAPLAAGEHALDLDAAALPAGVYLVRVATARGARALRVTVAR